MDNKQKTYYDLMMANIPEDVSKEDWEKEILQDIFIEESGQKEILQRNIDHTRFAKKLYEFEQKTIPKI